MQSLRILSLLLDYPTRELVDAGDHLLAALPSLALKPETSAELAQFIRTRCGGDLYDWQAQYDGSFERGRSLSLLLFEHLHGESRDRGQAMVDLLAQYKAAGLELNARELPDYIPLYLEFLSTQGEVNARLGLQEVVPILALLQCRLEERENNYAAIFSALLEMAQVKVDLADIKQQLAGEGRDDTPEALDKVWEEEVVTFTADSAAEACPSLSNRPLPGQRRDQEQVITLKPSNTATQV